MQRPDLNFVLLAAIVFLSASYASGNIDDAKAAYQEGQYDEAIEILSRDLAANPEKVKSRALLVITLLKVREYEFADTHIRALVRQGTPIALRYAKRLDESSRTLKARESAKRKLLECVEAFDFHCAVDQLDSLQVPEFEEKMLRARLAAAGGRFGLALHLLDDLSTEFPEEFAAIRRHRQFVEERHELYEKYKSWLEWFAFSHFTLAGEMSRNGEAWLPSGLEDLAGDLWGAGWSEATCEALEKWLEAITYMAHISPLSDRTGQALVYSALLFQPYHEFEVLADKILDAQGELGFTVDSLGAKYAFEIDADRREFRAQRIDWFDYPVPGSAVVTQLLQAILSFDGGVLVYIVCRYQT